jgi:hypothetical protein
VHRGKQLFGEGFERRTLVTKAGLRDGCLDLWTDRVDAGRPVPTFGGNAFGREGV